MSERIILYGAGGVGCVMGAHLHEHGHDVVLIARGTHREVLQRDGLTLMGHRGVTRHDIPTVGHPDEIDFRTGDAVILTMKTQDVAPALADLSHATEFELPIVCAQNGVASERIAARRFEHVYGMLIWLPAMFLEAGQVVSYGSPTPGLLDAGRHPHGVDPCIEGVTAALNASGLVARARPDIMRWKYNKLLSNLWNALMATLGPGADYGDFPKRIQAEAHACYEAAGIDFVPEDEARRQRDEVGVHMVHLEGQPKLGGSSWQSLERGLGSIETDYLNGEIVLLGHLHGVPTPYNRALQRAANRMARRGQKPGTLALRDLEAELEAGGADPPRA